jgi:N-acetylglucosamine kinase-like BadF-type ATPase
MCLAQAIGGREWNLIRSFVYGGDRARMASLAQPVGEAARDNDRTALRVLQEAGEELARLANCLTKRIGSRPVALAGSVVHLHPIVERAFRQDLVAPVEFITTDFDAALTAATLAATLNKA